MSNFFHGWRRKVGCVTLAMALIATTSWMRSRVVEDTLTIPDWRSEIQLESVDGQVVWSRLSPNNARGTFSWASEDINTDAKWTKFHPWKYASRGGFAFGTVVIGGWFDSSGDAGDLTTSGEIFLHFWAVPHWSIVISLTLMSAWLILWKPRRPVAFRTKRDNSTGNLQPLTREGHQ